MPDELPGGLGWILVLVGVALLVVVNAGVLETYYGVGGIGVDLEMLASGTIIGGVVLGLVSLAD